MAVRQYVGARYVPKFYEGVGGNTEWVSGVAYEPLTIVTYLNNSFTSKKPVPVGVGAPNVNSEYWANTGNYNQQIEQYRKDTEEYKAEVETYKNEVDNIPKNKSVLLFGDSYVQGVNGNGLDIEKEIISRTGWNCKSYYDGGCGYMRTGQTGKNMFSLMETAIASETKPDLITDVVLCASVYNDTGASTSETFTKDGFYNAVKKVVDACKGYFTKANITIVTLWCNNYSYNYIFAKVASWVANAAMTLGAKYDDNAIRWLIPYASDTSADNIHPNNFGYRLIAEKICTLIRGGRPALFEDFGRITAATGDTIEWKAFENKLRITGNVAKKEGQTFTSLCSLPECFRSQINVPITLRAYNENLMTADVPALIINGNSIYLGSDFLKVGTTYIIDTTVAI